MYSSKITTKGQMVIPKEIRNQLKIDKNVRVDITLENDKIILRINNSNQKLANFRTKAKKHLKSKKISVTDDEINKARFNLWRQRK